MTEQSENLFSAKEVLRIVDFSKLALKLDLAQIEGQSDLVLKTLKHEFEKAESEFTADFSRKKSEAYIELMKLHVGIRQKRDKLKEKIDQQKLEISNLEKRLETEISRNQENELDSKNKVPFFRYGLALLFSVVIAAILIPFFAKIGDSGQFQVTYSIDGMVEGMMIGVSALIASVAYAVSKIAGGKSPTTPDENDKDDRLDSRD